jgi:hypothetical protein
MGISMRKGIAKSQHRFWSGFELTIPTCWSHLRLHRRLTRKSADPRSWHRLTIPQHRCETRTLRPPRLEGLGSAGKVSPRVTGRRRRFWPAAPRTSHSPDQHAIRGADAGTWVVMTIVDFLSCARHAMVITRSTDLGRAREGDRRGPRPATLRPEGDRPAGSAELSARC